MLSAERAWRGIARPHIFCSADDDGNPPRQHHVSAGVPYSSTCTRLGVYGSLIASDRLLVVLHVSHLLSGQRRNVSGVTSIWPAHWTPSTRITSVKVQKSQQYSSSTTEQPKKRNGCAFCFKSTPASSPSSLHDRVTPRQAGWSTNIWNWTQSLAAEVPHSFLYPRIAEKEWHNARTCIKLYKDLGAHTISERCYCTAVYVPPLCIMTIARDFCTNHPAERRQSGLLLRRHGLHIVIANNAT